jgi:F-type H+-transporting ATPase subunit b
MDATLHALGGILLRAIPTFLLVILLHFYLKNFFFKPFEKMLHQRYEATEGARKLAEQILERAAAKASEFEAALRAAKGEVYQAQEKLYKQLQEQQAAELLAARKQAEAAVKQAKAELAQEVEAAQARLALESDRLATQIAESILQRSVA